MRFALCVDWLFLCKNCAGKLRGEIPKARSQKIDLKPKKLLWYV